MGSKDILFHIEYHCVDPTIFVAHRGGEIHAEHSGRCLTHDSNTVMGCCVDVSCWNTSHSNGATTKHTNNSSHMAWNINVVCVSYIHDTILQPFLPYPHVCAPTCVYHPFWSMSQIRRGSVVFPARSHSNPFVTNAIHGPHASSNTLELYVSQQVYNCCVCSILARAKPIKSPVIISRRKIFCKYHTPSRNMSHVFF